MSGPSLFAAPSTRVSELELGLVVARREQLADGVIALELTQPGGESLPEWTPGAHIDVVLDDGLVRQYSLCSSPGDRGNWTIGVLLDPHSRGGSRRIHEELQVGTAVRARGPRNHFALVTAERYQFVAGGIGITPMLPMIEDAEATGTPWSLLYGGRERSSMAFVERLSALGERVEIWPQDERGLLPLERVLGEPQPGTLIYACGPEPMLNAVEEQSKGWPAASLRLERFAARSLNDDAPGLDSYEVVCQRSGISVTVTAEQSILDVLEEAGVDVMSSCMEGTCGSCECEVIEGTPEHRDSVLTDEEQAANDVMMICVSRSREPRLVLDI